MPWRGRSRWTRAARRTASSTSTPGTAASTASMPASWWWQRAPATRGGAGLPEAGFGGGIQDLQGGGYGKQLKNDYRRYNGAYIGFSGRGEMIPNEGSYCEIDPRVVDKWGIPVLRFHWKFTDHEYLQVKHMQETFRALIKEMSGTPWGDMPS